MKIEESESESESDFFPSDSAALVVGLLFNVAGGLFGLFRMGVSNHFSFSSPSNHSPHEKMVFFIRRL